MPFPLVRPASCMQTTPREAVILTLLSLALRSLKHTTLLLLLPCIGFGLELGQACPSDYLLDFSLRPGPPTFLLPLTSTPLLRFLVKAPFSAWDFISGASFRGLS